MNLFLFIPKFIPLEWTFTLYESSVGKEESAYDDRMSLEHLCATCCAARAHAR
jgi:hypothetical protein